ncbi:hypothetical protein ADUPG1_011711 [Aduncisulcus paluster]|uniref:Uncharacterized protein n=1 Tax=Aduncisulcus paluster TaxID=2918883 RepID=A0ABQ5JWT9_9EUKA|nr:hypothetical protein ADUPG1_011711 [Aduncisulcus paluster]
MPGARPISDRQLLEYIADLSERGIKLQTEKGMGRISKCIRLAIQWRKHEGNKVIKDAIESLSSSPSITISSVKEKLRRSFRSKLIEEGNPNPDDAAESLVGFLAYNIKRLLRDHAQTTNPRVRSSQTRDDDAFLFIRRESTGDESQLLSGEVTNLSTTSGIPDDQVEIEDDHE